MKSQKKLKTIQKVWKAGQLVTVNDVVCRVKNAVCVRETCGHCEFADLSVTKFPCWDCPNVRTNVTHAKNKLQRNQYLQRLSKSKSIRTI